MQLLRAVDAVLLNIVISSSFSSFSSSSFFIFIGSKFLNSSSWFYFFKWGYKKESPVRRSVGRLYPSNSDQLRKISHEIEAQLFIRTED